MKNKILVSALALAAGSASAAVLDIEYTQTLGTEITMVTDGAVSEDYLSGGMQYKALGGASFEAFCVEIGQSYALAGVQSYTAGSFGSTQSRQLQGLFSTSYGLLSSDLDRAAFQTAVWEITHEQSAQLDASQGSYQFAFLNADSTAQEDTAFLNKVNGFLDAADSYQGPAKYQLTKLQHQDYQDLVTVTAVPEPGTYAMLLAGLGLVGFVARRRQRAG
ncbi:FxDxF family PEP-CTERM protein [Paucibacter sp. M5-1]|uniref:FxDxF family PEP-CTERM protein n=1 Tax=Paucibacter sp. M5-1 TaxID=3015998 RepID=UPI0022B92E12|nr:FxDxF family PEP-CTERM protein [Paucibacter sp. M5-1]MCZ7880819.1 FxDxF family PEP-CTERM protein [Paucibacter sp. M5-1]